MITTAPLRRRLPLVLSAVALVVLASVGAMLHVREPAASTPGAVSHLVDAPGPEDGLLPEGATIDDGHHPGIARLDPALLRALHSSSEAAGVPFTVTTGWRSERYQERLAREGIARHGSAREAARWVGTPTGSAHVRGEAVDLGPSAVGWLASNGAAVGLCQIYANENWHFELRPSAPTQGCPTPYTDASQDPRMR